MEDILTREQYEQYKKHITSREWRIDNLYHILDADGKDVIFRRNAIQQRMFNEWWYWTIVLKSRKVGSTTYCGVIETIDDMLFKNNYKIGFIADTREHASQITERIKFAHERLPGEIKNRINIVTDNKGELSFSNGSSIVATTSTMSSTVQKLIISEYGYICQYTPDKAEEIVTGSLNSVSIGNKVIVESTIRKNYGKYAEFIQQCIDRNKKGILPTKIQFHLMFYPWMDDPKCQLPTEGIEVYPRHEIYFRELEEKTHRIITPEQRAFWISKESINGPKVKQEFPSTLSEALEKVTEGTYYANEFEDMRAQKRICKVPHERGILVNTSWDLGLHHTVVWFYQNVGRARHIIDYCAGKGEKLLPHFHNILMDKQREFGYNYGIHVFPHDSQKGEDLAFDTRLGAMRAVLGERSCLVCPKLRIEEGISLVRQFLGTCWFDEEKTREGRDGLENYSMRYNTSLGQYVDEPLKDGINDDPADGFRYLATWETMIRKRDDRSRDNKGRNNTNSSSSPRFSWGKIHT